MRPRRFYIGFPPAVLRTTRNGIEYGLGAIPLGGYVKIPGCTDRRRPTWTYTSGQRCTSRRVSCRRSSA
jgi:regulator of sigma E protease